VPAWIRPLAIALGITCVVAVPPALATFSGENGRIIFNRFIPADDPADEDLEIWSVNPDGSDEKQLSDSDNGIAFFSDWSPDGTTIAFDSDRDGEAQIYVMDADGSNEHRLTDLSGFAGDPAYSPDGKWLAIDADWGDYPAKQGIWLIPSDGAGDIGEDDAIRVTRTPPTSMFDSEPQFSPDGEWIVFVRYRSCKDHKHRQLGEQATCLQAIFRVRTDGSGLDRLTGWGTGTSAPDWSPDGKWIAYDTGDAASVGDVGNIVLMRADGSGSRILAKGTPFDGQDFVLWNNPSFSPDGEQIVFTRFAPDSVNLWVMNTDGSGRHKVTTGEDNKADWGPAAP
jgi:Tol biopolymer transport system component